MITAYLYNSCTSCRKTDAMLKASGVPYTRREFFRERFTTDELRQVLADARLTPRDVLSRRSRVYKERDLEHQQLDDEALLDLMVAEPTLLRRPLVVDGQRAIVGHNPVALQAMIDRQQAAGESARRNGGLGGSQTT